MLITFLLFLATASGEKPSVEFQPNQPIYWSDERWSVFAYQDEEVCDIGHAATENTYLSLQYNARKKSVWLMVTNSFATSKDDGDTTDLNIFFTKNKAISQGWENVAFTIRVLPNENRALVSAPLSNSFLDAFASSELMAVMTPRNKVVGGASLAGSSKAIHQLRRCAFKVAGLNEKDPFLD